MIALSSLVKDIIMNFIHRKEMYLLLLTKLKSFSEFELVKDV